METLIKAENVTVLNKGRAVLDNVSLQVGARDFVTILGPNGAGKSLLLRCLLGVIRPDAGKVEKAPDTTVGYMPQQLLPEDMMPITVRHFLRLRCTTDMKSWDSVVEEVRVGDILDEQMHLLSGGEFQRVLLARALLKKPALLVLDEPAQNLDVTNQLLLYKLLKRVYESRPISILMVSHDLHLVMSCTKKVVCLFHHVCCSGEPHAVTRTPEFVNMFGDDMARMMSVYHHTHDHMHND